uniref:Tail protein n=1 Tax=viral metagenome TaxID=1070528 RepID=A0A6M3XMY5_9ZZZZ
MLMALGQFAFEIGTAAYQELARKTEWRHAETPRFGARPASQYLGPGAETISLKGVILPGLSGKHSAIATLRALGDEGDALPLVDAQGLVHGDFVILSIDESHSHFIDTGQARRADFAIELRRVA